MLRVIWAVALAAAVAIPALAAQPSISGPDLTSEQFKTLIVGKKLHHVSADTSPVWTADLTYQPDGTLEYYWQSGNTTGHYAGTWKIDGPKVCRTDKASGKVVCGTFRQSGDVFLQINPDGSLHGTDTVTH